MTTDLKNIINSILFFVTFFSCSTLYPFVKFKYGLPSSGVSGEIYKGLLMPFLTCECMDIFLFQVDHRLCHSEGFINLTYLSQFWLLYTLASLAVGFSLLQSVYTVPSQSFLTLNVKVTTHFCSVLSIFISIENEIHGGMFFFFFFFTVNLQYPEQFLGNSRSQMLNKV